MLNYSPVSQIEIKAFGVIRWLIISDSQLTQDTYWVVQMESTPSNLLKFPFFSGSVSIKRKLHITASKLGQNIPGPPGLQSSVFLALKQLEITIVTGLSIANRGTS